MINAIMAIDENGGTGKNGSLPWPEIKRDFQWFKNNTVGDIVVMGSNTFLDPKMPKPLPNRTNIVITSNPSKCPKAHSYISGDIKSQLLDLEQQNPDKTIWILGGANIIYEALSLIKNFYLSRIPGKFECDTFLDYKQITSSKLFTLLKEEKFEEVTFQVWTK
jgi:dihydrofolate reductase